MRAESSSTPRPQLSDLLLLVPVSIFGVGIPLGLLDVVYRLFDPMYGGPWQQRWLSAAAEIGFGLMAFFGLVSAWIVVVSSDATLHAHRRRTLVVALGLLVGVGAALYLLADWLLSGRHRLDVFLLVFSGLFAVAPMLVAARHLPRLLRAMPPAAMLRGCRHGQ
ncbi:hypothetical protein LMG31884_17180 [Xanthomonas hydrangeae]|uniref:hypothetical protein n=1 Tax=Xanthomonas hydrangeae TaxID=2775159 RepID=UPI001965C7ED|nr:hypothetical protein LMG31884_17180 [Xanthomonas hydrangeae]CAD7715605.1 hypothetical protein LMG31884_17180 [Xanthomonas hydrangeae]CAD7728448.1 hypothetical protein LMG31887_17170 [Xanthomonas hydrangeae]CAD7728452.1 hypothetical protein LMG31887_17170 [Xanthomonas hydrangeae]